MAGSQASLTPGLGPNSSPPVGGKRPTSYRGWSRSKASVTEHKDILIRLNAAAWGFIKMPQQPPSLSLETPVTTPWNLEGGHAAGLASPVNCRHLYAFCIQTASSSSALPVFLQGNPDFISFFFVNNLSACLLCWFNTALPGVTCQSNTTGRSAVWIKCECL